MNETMIERHNALVKPDDIVWHLGDFAMDDRMVSPFLKRLNGTKILIPGNHDKCHPCHKRHARETRRYKAYGFIEIYPTGYDIIHKGVYIHMNHMPYFFESPDPRDNRYPEWRPDPSKSQGLLNGHVHEKWKSKGNMLNVGVDQWNFAPILMEDALDLVVAQVKRNACPPTS